MTTAARPALFRCAICQKPYYGPADAIVECGECRQEMLIEELFIPLSGQIGAGSHTPLVS